jgi:hypothetical protein
MHYSAEVDSRSQTMLDLQWAFEAAGVEFIGSPDDAPEVRLVCQNEPNWL